MFLRSLKKSIFRQYWFLTLSRKDFVLQTFCQATPVFLPWVSDWILFPFGFELRLRFCLFLRSIPLSCEEGWYGGEKVHPSSLHFVSTEDHQSCCCLHILFSHHYSFFVFRFLHSWLSFTSFHFVSGTRFVAFFFVLFWCWYTSVGKTKVFASPNALHSRLTFSVSEKKEYEKYWFWISTSYIISFC